MKTIVTFAFASLAVWSQAQTADFEDLSLAPNSYENGAGLAGAGFTSHTIGFNNSYDSNFGSWAGFAYSNVQDATTPGFGNQYAAAPGGAHGGSNYAVGFFDSFTPTYPSLSTAGSAETIEGLWVTNDTYAALSMRDGDSFAKKFGGATGGDADWYLLTAIGYRHGIETGTSSFYLADYRSTDNSQDYIVSDWRHWDLSSLGADTLSFYVTGSDVGAFGLNTPSYFAIDDVQATPEPATFAVLGLGLVAVVRKRAKR